MRGTHNKLGEGERKVRLGQDSLPNIDEMSRKLAESKDVVLPAPTKNKVHIDVYISFSPAYGATL